MGSSYDVIIVGLGGMGSAAAFHCARSGMRVLGLEQFGIPHDQGSSHGYSRMIRMAYYEHPDYVPLLRGAYESWDELGELCGQPVLHRTGGVYMGPADGHVVPGAIRAAQQHALAHEPLVRQEIARRYPMFTVPDGYAGVYEPQAGFLIPELCVSAHVEQALRHGADLRAHEPVVGWSANDRAVTVQTSHGTYSASTLVFCSGTWTGKLLRDLGVELVVTRQVLGWVWPNADPERFSLGRFPVWGIEQTDGSLAYGFPTHAGAPGLKLARHGRGTVTDPDRVPRTVTATDEREVQDILERYLPSAKGPTLTLRTCLYTNSPDGHFIIDRLPGRANVLLAGGFSGHGFKFASIIGRTLADLVRGEARAASAVEFLSLARFGRGL